MFRYLCVLGRTTVHVCAVRYILLIKCLKKKKFNNYRARERDNFHVYYSMINCYLRFVRNNILIGYNIIVYSLIFLTGK